MTNVLERIPVPVTDGDRDDEFKVHQSEQGLGYNLPQTVGRKLWLPMFIMSLMGFAVGVVLAIVRAGLIADADPADLDTIATLNHLVPAFMFIGFLSVFAAISFAVARILGAFRKGGGEVQETAGAAVQTLKLPATAMAFLGFMMMGMMAILFAVVAHFVVGAGVDLSESSLVDAEQWAVGLEAVRRMGVAMYLVGIAFGLGTIIHVLRFQARRIREVARIN